MKKILIFGPGYVGKAVASELLTKKNFFVGLTCRNREAISELSGFGREVLLLSEVSIDQLVEEYDTIVFCVAPKNSSEYRETYFNNAEALVKGLERNKKTKQIIYTGTCSVYGDHKGESVNETSPLYGNTEQARILIQTEQELLKAEEYGHKICIFRLGEITGPGRTVADRLKKSEGATFPGDGSGYCNFSPLPLIVSGISFAIDRQLQGIFNLCSDEHPARKVYYDEICQTEHIAPVVWDPEKANTHAGNKIVRSDKYFSMDNMDGAENFRKFEK